MKHAVCCLLTLLLAVPAHAEQDPPEGAHAGARSGPSAVAPAGALQDRAGGAESLIPEALRSIALDKGDLSFRTDYADHPDSFRLTVVDSLLTSPLDTEAFVLSAAEAAVAASTLESLVSSCALDLDLRLETVDCPAAAQTGSGDLGVEPFHALLPALEEVDALMAQALVALDAEERGFLREHAPVLLEEEEFDPDKPIDRREEEEERDEALGERLLEIAGRVDYRRIAEAGRVLAAAADAAVPSATALADRPPAPKALPDGAPASGDVLRIIETTSGTLVLGGPGPTTYEGPCAVIIDLGGDDTYRLAADADGRRAARAIIDVGGDDVYAGGHHAFGAGFLGASVLVDLAGDDRYAAGSFSLGSGLFGVGVLHDVDGNDRYVGDTCVQGSGAFGIGVLRDDAGNDVYESALFSQAFGFVKGSGLLIDRDGNDVYVAGLTYTDEIRYFDHYLSLSQGFGFGWRPDASGGVGILVDVAGNDVYTSDIFGQGSSYWFSVGGLVDYAGNDQYVSYQYAQGAATHITVAALIDADGDDNYVSKGVSQGCGHDLAIGILHDLGGDDNYTCHDLSQAAGNANGIGVLLDDAGDDVYSVRNPLNTHGYGNRRREYGSVGLFIDAGGADVYSGLGADGTWWTQSFHGVGVDTETGEVDR